MGLLLWMLHLGDPHSDFLARHVYGQAHPSLPSVKKQVYTFPGSKPSLQYCLCMPLISLSSGVKCSEKSSDIEKSTAGRAFSNQPHFRLLLPAETPISGPT